MNITTSVIITPMSGSQLRTARGTLGFTQQEAARRWRVSQPYLSLMENGRRPVPERLVRLLARREREFASALRPKVSDRTADDLPTCLGTLGYPGFAYLANPVAVVNPADLVLSALRAPELPARVVEALPWVLMTFVDLPWTWLVAQAKLANVQNRLGYVVTLARQVAERMGRAGHVQTLAEVERELEDARLAREDTLARSMTDAERRYVLMHRPDAAAHWNLLTRLRPDDLRYAE
jgi:transcriptional regulator with XRE-family HTH domain